MSSQLEVMNEYEIYFKWLAIFHQRRNTGRPSTGHCQRWGKWAANLVGVKRAMQEKKGQEEERERGKKGEGDKGGMQGFK